MLTSVALPVLILLLLGLAFGLGLGWASLRFRVDSDPVVDQIDALLPQTQCAQCGFPGCRPYAAAINTGKATDVNIQMVPSQRFARPLKPLKASAFLACARSWGYPPSWRGPWAWPWRPRSC